jgi:hypothetical protein
MGNVTKFFQALQVRDCGLSKVRIGNKSDGGYVAYMELCKNSPAVYSFGIGHDIGFEKDWVRRFPDCNIFLYDPMIEDIPEHHKRFTFHRFGIGLRWKPLEYVTADSTLKMDVEWDEWGAFQIFKEEELIKFSQLLIEFHLVHAQPQAGLTPYFTRFYADILARVNQDLFASYLQVLERLLNKFYIFHVHANNSLPMVQINGSTFPPLIEVSFERKDLAKKNDLYQGTFPIGHLDLPNKTDRPDIIHWYPIGAHK